jgi:hypothetical protein
MASDSDDSGYETDFDDFCPHCCSKARTYQPTSLQNAAIHSITHSITVAENILLLPLPLLLIQTLFYYAIHFHPNHIFNTPTRLSHPSLHICDYCYDVDRKNKFCEVCERCLDNCCYC